MEATAGDITSTPRARQDQAIGRSAVWVKLEGIPDITDPLHPRHHRTANARLLE